MQLHNIIEQEEVEKLLNNFSNSLDSLKQGTEYIRNMACKFVNYGNVIAYKEDNIYIGFVAFYANDICNKVAYISMIAVNSEYRGNNVGSLLIKECCDMSSKNGMIKVQLEVRNDNDIAIHVYKKNGFEYYKDASKNSIYMIKIIGDVQENE